jgi:hypothetical protein
MKHLSSLLLALTASACGARTDLLVSDAAVVAEAAAPDVPADAPVSPCTLVPGIAAVDLLFMIDNSNSMAENQSNLARNIGVLVDQLVDPPRVRDPMTGVERPRFPAVRDLHIGVISSDLGTPGSVVPSCANTDTGDDGLLNPIRNGRALSTHLPWTTAPAGSRPARCADDPQQYPSFLTFDPAAPGNNLREDFVCNAYLSIGGCGLEQQLESVYRALIVRNPRAMVGNTDPNAGFVRDNALLGIVMVTDEEDGSVRDCRYAERGMPCTDGVSVFDIMSPSWSSNDLNLRMYLYTPGSAQDPTWPIDRYIDPTRPTRGFLGLKPGHPERVIFSAITGVPLNLPRRGDTVDWAALLGSRPDGSDGFVGMSAEGPVSMRQSNQDPMCPLRVVPACRREGSVPRGCGPMEQYYASPARRIVQVARRFDEAYRNGSVSSICRNDYSDALLGVVQRLQVQLCRE